jgi:hypothetical protein
MGDKLDRCLSLLAGERVEVGEQIVIRESSRNGEDVRVHSTGVSRSISCFGQGSGMRHERGGDVGSTEGELFRAEEA